jgi:uncharacterized protein (TIGR03437 family)
MPLPVSGWSRRLRLPAACLPILSISLAHALPAQDRITLAVDDSQRVTLPGHVSPRIASAVDRGPVDPSLQIPYVTLALKPSASQQRDLDRLLAQQQDPSSPGYHGWLTPEQYAQRFGVSRGDIDKIVGWLGRHNLTVKSVARGGNTIAFGGPAGQIETAFGVAIHRYIVDGVSHYANAADPTIPAAFQGVVLGIYALHDFRLKPLLRRALHPRDNTSQGELLAPDDVATIYNITPLYDAGIDGAGQKLVVAGQTEIELSDITQFRTYFNLPAIDLTTTLVPGSPNPGIQETSGDLQEADLDLELSGAVARNASINFVYAGDSYNGAIGALQYAIDNNLAPIVSISYGDCEVDIGSADAQVFASWGIQANAQGQTIFAASGDDGVADCFGDGGSIIASKSVDMPASLPQVTGVGGTEFAAGGSSYWSNTNTSNHASARSYIPETTWNDSLEDGSPAASGGGPSIFFSKPSWQTGAGVPADGARDVPDVSISASPNTDGYLIYTGGSQQILGGTSVGPPQFSGIMALLGQYLVANGFQSSPNLGNINQVLYPLAAVTGVFHDITTGNNSVIPCNEPCNVAELIGYNAGPGYDQVTGLGTPDVYNLVTAWHGRAVSSKGSVTLTLSASPASVAFGATTLLTAAVTGAGGATPTGTVTFAIGTDALGSATLNSGAVATLTLSGVQLAVGANTIAAQYTGDNSYYGASASANVVETSPANGPPSVTGLANAASFTSALAPGGILSVFGTQLAPATAGAPGLPLPTMLAGATVTVGGVSAPLFYVSPAQLNVQIPYEVPPGAGVALRVYNNSESAFDSFTVTATAPAIFSTNSQGTGQGAILNTSYQVVDTSHPATPGSTYLQIYCMGLGAVSNQPADGAPASSTTLSQTSVTPSVTIGGVTANASFSGLAPGFVGLYQVNVQVPAAVAAGSAVTVSMSIGGVTSNTVTIAVGQ